MGAERRDWWYSAGMNGLALVLAVSLAGQAGRVDGEWVWRMRGATGEVTARVVLRTEGTGLTGTFHLSGGQRLEIGDGVVVDDDLRFTVRRRQREGGTMVYEMVGRVEAGGRRIRGTARMPAGEPPGATEWVMERVMPAPKDGPASWWRQRR